MDDDTLLHQFETCTLPFDQWTHRTHVKVAYLYCCRHPFDDALERMRRGIQRYNAANDVPEGPEQGYHETMTVAWTHLIDMIRREFPVYADADSFVDDQPQLAKRQAMRFFYSRERFLTPEAKTTFVPPDLAPLPVSPRTESRPGGGAG